ncbi:DUF4153 domain-containing protein [Caulobacter sp. LARHSG274]
MPASAPRRARPSFRDLSFAAKASVALLLVVVADLLFHGHPVGATLGAFALLLTLATAALRPDLRGDRKAGGALLAAAVLALVLVEAPSLLAWMLFWAALSLAALLPRAHRFDDAWRWSQRLLGQAVVGLVGPWVDLRRARRLGQATRRRRWGEVAALLALPAVGGAVFLGLFAMANPVIAQALGALRLPAFSPDLGGRMVLWLAVLTLAWGVLRPRRRRVLPVASPRSGVAWAGISVASVTLSLVVFNALFAVQNGLDAVILWGGAGPPAGLTLAQYAHRGAYPLIATALLAGLFVLVALDPRSPTAKVPLIRLLVVLWVGQNLFLVASSILRTVDYVQAYSLTRLRIAALVWMGLVGLGLVLTCWRMLRGKSGAWLINANAAAALLVLAASCVVDLGAVAAAWNVRHAREVGGRGPELDVCYLNALGPSALVSLVDLERRTPPPELVDRVAWVRQINLIALRERQSAWRAWTWRGARRLARVEALQRERPLANSAPAYQRECDGRPVAPPAPPEPPPPSVVYEPAAPPAAAPSPLTPGAEH